MKKKAKKINKGNHEKSVLSRKIGQAKKAQRHANSTGNGPLAQKAGEKVSKLEAKLFKLVMRENP